MLTGQCLFFYSVSIFFNFQSSSAENATTHVSAQKQLQAKDCRTAFSNPGYTCNFYIIFF